MSDTADNARGSESAEFQFDDLANGADGVINRAARIECPIVDYIVGLRGIAADIQVAIEAAEKDLEG